MKHWTENDLLNAGYTLENAKIDSVDLSMEDHGCLTLKMVLKGGGWGCVYGGYSLGHGYVGASDDFTDGSSAGMEYIIRIMNTVGSPTFNDMVDRYVRVARKHGECLTIIGNILSDTWFDAKKFFLEKEGEDK